MPRGVPNKKAPEANGQAISKLEAMRRALSELGTEVKPTAYRKFIKSNFGLTMDNKMVGSYKVKLRKEAPKKSAVIETVQAPSAGGFSLEDLAAVKSLADKIGADKVRQLAAVLAK